MAIGLDLKHAADINALEIKLYEEYEQRLTEVRGIMVCMVHKYLDMELGKLLLSFSEHKDAIAEWKAENPPEEIVYEATAVAEAEQYIQDLEDQIVGMEAEISELNHQIGVYAEKDVLLNEAAPNQVEII